MLLLSKKMKILASIIVTCLACIFLFQNCSKYSSNINKFNSNSNSSNNQNGVTTPPNLGDPNSNTNSCFVEGTQVLHGQSRNFYNTQTSNNCDQVKIARNCANGVMSGAQEFKYLTCSINNPNPNPDPNPNGQKGTSFIFNYIPVGIKIPNLNPEICNDFFKINQKLFRYNHDGSEIIIKRSDDGQLYAVSKSDDSFRNSGWVSEASKSSDRTPISLFNTLCLAINDPRNGFRPEQLAPLLYQALPAKDQPLRNSENKVLLFQEGPSFVRECKDKPIKFLQVFSRHISPCQVNGDRSSNCLFQPIYNQVAVDQVDQQLFNNIKFQTGSYWKADMLNAVGVELINVEILKQLGLHNGEGHPCPGNF